MFYLFIYRLRVSKVQYMVVVYLIVLQKLFVFLG